MKKKDKVYEYEIKIDFLKDEVKQTKEEHSIIGANKNYICLDTLNFKSLKIKPSYSGDTIDFEAVNTFESKYSNMWDYMMATLFTSEPDEKIVYKKMKDALENFIYEKHGRYCNAATFLDKINI